MHVFLAAIILAVVAWAANVTGNVDAVGYVLLGSIVAIPVGYILLVTVIRIICRLFR